MNAYSFYGGRTGAPFEIVKIYSNLAGLLNNLNTDPDVQYDEYVRVDYTSGGQDNYNPNASKDLNINTELKPDGYKNVTNWNNSIWQKTIDGPKFIVNLSNNVPNFTAETTKNPLAPSENPSVFIDSTNVDRPIITFGLPAAAKIYTGEDPSKDFDVAGVIKKGDYYITSNGQMFVYTNTGFVSQGFIVNAPLEAKPTTNIDNTPDFEYVKQEGKIIGWNLLVPNATQWYVGEREPSENTEGAINDFYLDSLTGQVWKKDSSGWKQLIDKEGSPIQLIGSSAKFNIVNKEKYNYTVTLENVVEDLEGKYSLTDSNSVILVEYTNSDSSISYYYFYKLGNTFVYANITEGLVFNSEYKSNEPSQSYSVNYLNDKLIKVFSPADDIIIETIVDDNGNKKDKYHYFYKNKDGVLIPYIGDKFMGLNSNGSYLIVKNTDEGWTEEIEYPSFYTISKENITKSKNPISYKGENGEIYTEIEDEKLLALKLESTNGSGANGLFYYLEAVFKDKNNMDVSSSSNQIVQFREEIKSSQNGIFKLSHVPVGDVDYSLTTPLDLNTDDGWNKHVLWTQVNATFNENDPKIITFGNFENFKDIDITFKYIG